MNWKKEWYKLAAIIGVFLLFYYLPVDRIWSFFTGARVTGDGAAPIAYKPAYESLALAKWYAREHVLLCLVPAFFIAGGIAVFVSQTSVMKYLGPNANKFTAYGVASVSGTILAVCSCTVLPLFAGIYRMGAGLGPATAFLYSGPAINVLAIVLTARVLGTQFGLARAVAAVVFSVVIGALMHIVYRKEAKNAAAPAMATQDDDARPLWQNALFFGLMVGILVFANWGKPDADQPAGLWTALYGLKWKITAALAVGFAGVMAWLFAIPRWKMLIAGVPVAVLALVFPQSPHIAFAAGVIGLCVILATSEGEPKEWFGQSWGFAKQILPLLLVGVLIAGVFLGRPNSEGLIPSKWIASLVGGNSLQANAFASVSGALMYFATLTEVPILQGLLGSGMGNGPALALLLAGPALSLPNMLVIRSVMGTQKTVAYVSFVVIMATITGIVFGIIS